MANYNEMPKSDRDNTHALDAEAEFQTFLTKYPHDPLAPQAEQHLREVQESLAEGQYRIAYYYYLKGDRKAAAGRLIPLVRRYPLYSKSDNALWMLGDMFEKSERKDFAAVYFSQIVKNYPLSPKANDARAKLKAFGVPVPQPDPQAVAWMQKEQNTPRPKEPIYRKPLAIVHSGPDLRMAARSGAPQLQPDVEEEGVDILKGGGGRATLATSTNGGSGGSGGGGVVSTVKPGEPAPAGSEDANASAADTAANGTATAGTDTQANNTNATAKGADAQANSTATNADGTSSSNSNSTSTDANKTDNTQSTADSSNQNPNGKESSSKKKGLKKILPW